MPTFPTYRGTLPACLNPLNPRHYLLLAYWIYFRPTALKCYCYQADPELYQADTGFARFRREWRVPAYRNLYLMMPLLMLLVTVPIVLGVSWLQDIPIEWGSMVFGVLLGMFIGWLSGIVFKMSESVIGILLFGMAAGVTTGIFSAIGFDANVGWLGSSIIIFSIAMLFAMAMSAYADVLIGILFSIFICTTFFVIFWLYFGMYFGIFMGLFSGMVGGMRGLFYPFQLIPALFSRFRGTMHPVAWDELLVVPLPGGCRAVMQRLQQDEPQGLRLLVEVSRNPFQRWIARKAMYAYLHNHPTPLHFFYHLLVNPDLGEYVFAPVIKSDWRRVPATRQLLLGELAGQWVDTNQLGARLGWYLSHPGRRHQPTPLTRFAGMLYELLDQATIADAKIDLSRYRDVYTGLEAYPGGQEIARSFEVLAAFLAYRELADLAHAGELTRSLPRDNAIRPAVLEALQRLGAINAEVAIYKSATSHVTRLAALGRAADCLGDLKTYVAAEVLTPEQFILQQIIQQWSRLVSETSGVEGRAAITEPVPNPYVAGNPVHGALFVGREEIMRRLEEIWCSAGQVPSVILYGHRRMGKSSILHNLGQRFGTQTTIVDFNMQRVGLVSNTGELFSNLALALYDTLSPAQQDNLPEPDEERFTTQNPYTAFDRFLRQLDGVRGEQRFIVTVDEFELIEELIDVGNLEPRLLAYWRSLIQTYPWFVMALAGLHTLEELRHDYWNPFFGSITAIDVSFLTPAAARRLITQPSPDFNIDYDEAAIAEIISLTNGQPYLVQLIGHALVTRFNRQTFEEGKERPRRFALADVEAVITASEFYRDGNAYFNGVWSQAEQSEPAGQTEVLRALSHAFLTEAELARVTGLDPAQLHAALFTLQRHDVIAPRPDGHYGYTVELMRRWVADRG